MASVFDITQSNLEEMSEDMSIDLVTYVDELKCHAGTILKHYKVPERYIFIFV